MNFIYHKGFIRCDGCAAGKSDWNIPDASLFRLTEDREAATQAIFVRHLPIDFDIALVTAFVVGVRADVVILRNSISRYSIWQRIDFRMRKDVLRDRAVDRDLIVREGLVAVLRVK